MEHRSGRASLCSKGSELLQQNKEVKMVNRFHVSSSVAKFVMRRISAMQAMRDHNGSKQPTKDDVMVKLMVSDNGRNSYEAKLLGSEEEEFE
jgi:hypothetical protein